MTYESIKQLHYRCMGVVAGIGGYKTWVVECKQYPVWPVLPKVGMPKYMIELGYDNHA